MRASNRSGCFGIKISAMALAFLVATAQAQAQGRNWAGFYAGLNAGGTWGNADTDISCADNTGVGFFCPALYGSGAFPSSLSTDLDGFIGGGQAGYNFQRGMMVFGIEADIAWTSIDGSTSVATDVPPIDPSVSRASQDLEWLGTVRGRLGYAAHNNFLLYATGGFAFGKVDYQYSVESQISTDNVRASGSTIKTGWTIGGGGEYSFGRWSLKGEYLYYDLGEETARGEIIGGGAPINVFATPTFETQGHIIRAGVNFKLGRHSKLPVPLK
jgi:outer membrane immunogenic protein